MDNTPWHSISSVCHPWGELLLFSHSAWLLYLIGEKAPLEVARTLNRVAYPGR